MIRINENYKKLKASYLFSEIAKRVAEYQEKNPEKEIIRLGIGDVTRALPPACIKAFHRAVDEMAADGCEMIEEKDLANPKQGQKALDIIMQDSWQAFEY